MAANAVVKYPFPDKLQKVETADSLDHWIHQFKLYIQRDPVLAPYLAETWDYGLPTMGFTDPERLPAGALTAEEKSKNCKLFLAHVASFMKVPYYRISIERRTTNAESIWQLLRRSYNVETSAETLLDIGSVTYDKTESYLGFYQRLLYLVESNLAPANVTVDHVKTGDTGDSLSVTMMDLIALNWIQKIEPRLYDRIKIDFAVRIKAGERLSSLVPDIAKALPGLLKSMDSRANINLVNSYEDYEDDTTSMDTGIFRIGDNRSGRPALRNSGSNRGNSNPSRGKLFRGGPRSNNNNRRPRPTCNHCIWLRDTLGIKEVDPYHQTSSCSRAISSSVRSIIENSLDSIPEEDEGESEEEPTGSKKAFNSEVTPVLQMSDQHTGTRPPEHKAQDCHSENPVKEEVITSAVSEYSVQHLKRKVLTLTTKSTSPKMLVTIQGEKTELLIDEGSELDCLDGAFGRKIGVRFKNSNRSATAAGSTDLTILGESEDDVVVNTMFQSARIPINLGKVTIVENLGVDLILGEGGKARNQVSTNSKDRTIDLVQNGKTFTKPYLEIPSSQARICRLEEGPTTLYTGDSVSIKLPSSFHNSHLSITPRGKYCNFFDPGFTDVKDVLLLKNTSDHPVTIKNHEHLADIRQVTNKTFNGDKSSNFLVHDHKIDPFKFQPTVLKPSPPDIDSIDLDPDNTMTPEMKKKFQEVNLRYKNIFTTTPGRYSGYYGDSDTSIRFSSKPVQNRKVAMPTYNEEMNNQLGDKMDELIDQGIMAEAEKVGVSIEYISPSLLVPKPGEDKEWRLVTDFSSLNRFIQRDASTSPTIQEAKKALSSKKYFAELDLSAYFFQGGLRREDCAFLGIMHPFRGPLVYTASPQGLKNSSELSYNRLGKVYGDLVKEGRMTRMADGVFPLGNSHEELLENYTEVLDRAEKAGLTFKPKKTRISPRNSIIFGWCLNNGRWSPQGHVISSLSRAVPPATVKQMRSFLGAMKQLSESIKGYAEILHPLEQVVGSRASSERIVWNEDLTTAFNKAKLAVSRPEGIYVPRREDRLVTSSDFSNDKQSIGGLLTIIRTENGVEKRLLGGHYSAKIEGVRKNWFPCDGEAYGMQRVIQHFAHFIRDSVHDTVHLTDSMPVVMAHRRAITGRFSTSPKIATLLATLSSFPIRVEHRPGSDMSVSDHASRNPPKPCPPKCGICIFNSEAAEMVDKCAIFQLNDEGQVNNFFKDPENIPFLQLRTWRDLQRNDAVHNKLLHLMSNGQEPERKKTGGIFTTLKHLHGMFLRNDLILHKSGVVMTRTKGGHFGGYSISVPESLIHGMTFMLHARLGHPKRTQLVKFMSRYFYVPALPNVIDQITSSCLQCLSTARLPKPLLDQTTTIPEGPGTSFAADVLERNGQAVFVCKDIHTQFVSASISDDQTTVNLKDAIISNTAPFVSVNGATLKLDSAPAFKSLSAGQDRDPEFSALGLKIELSRPLNKNGNPSAESTIAEVKREILNVVGKDDKLSPSTLAIAVRRLNQRIRSNGKSAFEILTSRDIMSGQKFSTLDSEISQEIAIRRQTQHLHDKTSKSKSRSEVDYVTYKPGDIVMLREQPDLDKKRDTYVVVKDEGGDNLVEIRKMVKQLRMATYKVKRDQIFEVFSTVEQLENHDDQQSLELDTNTIEEKKIIDKPQRTKRKAALKSESRSHRMAMERVVSIEAGSHKTQENEKKKKFITIYYFDDQNNIRNAEDDLEHDSDDGRDDSDQDIPVHQDVSEYGSELSNSSARSEADHDDAFLGSPVNSSMTSMTQSERLELSGLFVNNSSDDSLSPRLEWDNTSLAVNLSDPLEPTNLFADIGVLDDGHHDLGTPDNDSMMVNLSDQMVSTPAPRCSLLSDNVFNDDLVDTMTSPDRRVTRSMLNSGEFSLFSSASDIFSPFERENQLRRPMKVVFDKTTPNIKSADKRVSSRPRSLTKSAPPSPQSQ